MLSLFTRQKKFETQSIRIDEDRDKLSSVEYSLREQEVRFAFVIESVNRRMGTEVLANLYTLYVHCIVVPEIPKLDKCFGNIILTRFGI